MKLMTLTVKPGGLRTWIFAALLVAWNAPLKAETFALMTEELPPYSMTVEGQATGASVDIVSELYRRAGFAFEVRIMPWKRADLAARTQSYHCFFPVQRSQENEVLFRWVSPIMISQSAFYTLSEPSVEIRTLSDARRLKIGTYNGSGVASYLQELGYQLELTTTDAPNLRKLEFNRIDVWAADTLTATYLARQANETELEEQLVYFTTLRALACNLGTPQRFIDKLNLELKAMYADGSIDQLLQPYR